MKPTPIQIEWARRLLAHEASDLAAGDGDTTTAPGRVYDKIHAQLAPIVGDAGVEALLMRSAKLTPGEFSGVATVFGGSTNLRARLQARDPAVTTESVVTLFGTFFALITTFIGERLTSQVLRGAWPTLDLTAQAETKNE